MSMRPGSKSFLAQYRCEAIVWARGVLADPNAIILDTETTGLNHSAEIIEISIINTWGEPLLDTLIKPKGKIPIDAVAVHGITAGDVATAPTWPQIDKQVSELLQTASRVVIYNAGYDARMIQQTRGFYALPPLDIPAKHYQCAMKRYAEFCGQWSGRHRSFKWQPLDGGHRALGDCRATLRLLQKMAQTKEPTP